VTIKNVSKCCQMYPGWEPQDWGSNGKGGDKWPGPGSILHTALDGLVRPVLPSLSTGSNKRDDLCVCGRSGSIKWWQTVVMYLFNLLSSEFLCCLRTKAVAVIPFTHQLPWWLEHCKTSLNTCWFWVYNYSVITLLLHHCGRGAQYPQHHFLSKWNLRHRVN
jgi:hypothetical protein